MQLDITNAHFDLLSVGIAVAAIGLLGFVVYFNNRKSITNQTFFIFSLLTIAWGISNYSEYKFPTIETTLWALRIHLFISSLHALFFFKLSYVFPQETIKLPNWYRFFIVPLVIVSSVLTLTPFVFSGIIQLAPIGQVTNPERGPGIVLFALTAIGLLIAGITVLFVKTVMNHGIKRRQSAFILCGMFLTACLILSFNLILPVRFNNLNFIPLGALFVLPFIGLTSYTIYRHKLFDIKVATTAFVAFLVTIFSFINIIFSTQPNEIIINSTAFLVILIGSIQLIKSILKEIYQREKIEKQEKEMEVVNAKLGAANERLKELDKQKSEFIGFASHQLRSPLTAIKGYASLVLEGDYGQITDDLRHAAQIIFESANTLVTVVSDYLNVSSIELGQMKYDFKAMDLNDLVKSVIEELKQNVEKKGLKLTYECDTTKTYLVNVDSEKIKQVLMNIIDNSAKYTPKGEVKVSLTKNSSGKTLFAVKDTGIGISKDTIPKLFAKFIRAKNANETNIRGTGLGLFIAKEIITAHEGKIWVESEGEGKGSQFYVELAEKKS
jgi:signal transduction histidine kinase